MVKIRSGKQIKVDRIAIHNGFDEKKSGTPESRRLEFIEKAEKQIQTHRSAETENTFQWKVFSFETKTMYR